MAWAQKITRYVSVLVLGLALTLTLGSANPLPAAANHGEWGLRACGYVGAEVKWGSSGSCVRAVQRFLRLTINHRGYGPICPSTQRNYNFGGPIVVDGQYGPQTHAYIRCYQEYVNGRNSDGHWWYPERLSYDGWVGRQTYRAMYRTCDHDDRFLRNNGTAGRFGGRWFCTH